jgi:hypothetical protein
MIAIRVFPRLATAAKRGAPTFEPVDLNLADS